MKRLLGILALLTFATVPPVASAHQGNPNFQSEITSVRPAPLGEGLRIEVVNFDDHVRLANESGRDVVIKGYDGEPYARIAADGTVAVNLNSPAYYLNEDRYANVTVPARADAEAQPEWKVVGDDGEFEWHDHRSHYMGQGTPPQVKDESERTSVFDYAIPIEVGGRPAKIDGTLTWVGTGSKAPVIPFVILGLAVLALIWFAVRRRRAGRPGDEESAEGRGGDEPAAGQEPPKSGEPEAW